MKQPVIAKSAKVFEGAKVLGNVTIGERCGIWYNAVLRGDMTTIVIGDDSNIQDCAVVHGGNGYDVNVGKRVTVGHGCILHGCTIGDDVLVGMGSILLNGCEIGAGSLVAAGSLVPQNAKLPGDMLIMGSPAKAVRPLKDSERAYVREANAEYVELVKE